MTDLIVAVAAVMLGVILIGSAWMIYEFFAGVVFPLLFGNLSDDDSERYV